MLDDQQVVRAATVQVFGVGALGVQHVLCGACGYADGRPGVLVRPVSRAG